MENVKIVAVCDILIERAESLKNTYAPDAETFDDYIKMLDTVKPDVLHVCTPHYLHSEMAIAALKRNIHVLLEKPVSITMAQVDELLEAEKESKAKICISFQNRYLNRNKVAKELIDSGKAGKVLFANGTVLWNRNAPYYVDSHWRGFMATEGGGVMINQAIHTLDLMLWMCGDPEKLTAMTANYHLKDVIDVEDTASAYITFKSGAKGMFYATTANYTDSPISLEIICENMKLMLRDDDLYIDGVKQELYDTALSSDGKGYWGVGHMMLFNDFYKKITTDESMPIDVSEASKALRVLLAMYESKGNEITF
jgi:predicted dehydrogenase